MRAFEQKCVSLQPIIVRNMKKIILKVVAIALLVALGVAGWMAYRTLMRQSAVEETCWVYICEGQVDDASGVLGGDAVRWALDYYDYEEKLAEGRLDGAYRLEAGTTAMDVARRITRHQQTPVRIAFNNIRLKEQWAGRVAQKIRCDSVELLRAMTSPDFLREADMDEANIIGVLLPDTYEVYWNTSAEDLLARMLKEYRRFWNEKRVAQAEGLGLTPQEVTILASIAEEETLDRSERGVVGRLYWNRLQLMMPLQADPTVKFALGDFGLKRILNRHLEVDSPYNTYRYEGLPPGPIRMVEKATIDTILNASIHTYLYMCAKPDFSGRHNFATTYGEHLRNAEAYHRALNQRQ